jgi:hypothetical protein
MTTVSLCWWTVPAGGSVPMTRPACWGRIHLVEAYVRESRLAQNRLGLAHVHSGDLGYRVVGPGIQDRRPEQHCRDDRQKRNHENDE